LGPKQQNFNDNDNTLSLFLYVSNVIFLFLS
jgi:hypothetical protein